jgi:hypothetical protein
MSQEPTVEAYLNNRLLEEIEAYTKRGRTFAKLEIEELESQWAAAFKRWATKRLRREPCDSREMDDFLAELALRDRQPPLHLVRAEFDALCAAQDEQHQKPGVLARMERQFTDELDAFLQSVSRKRKN